MRGYKIFPPDLLCIGFQYEIGKTYEMDDNIVLHERGFHFCEHPTYCFKIRPYTRWRMCEIEASGRIIKAGADEDKCVCSKITIIRELTDVELARLTYGGDDSRSYDHGNGWDYGYGFGGGNGAGDGYGVGFGGNGCGHGHSNLGVSYGISINRVLIFKEG